MVRVHDIESALNFYCAKLGLVETRRFESETGRFTNVFLAAPGDMPSASEARTPLLELTYNWPAKDGSVPEVYGGGRNFGHLAYEVENIYATCAALQDAGIVINRPPRDGRMAFINSPEGIAIELLQSGDALPPSEPWLSIENTGAW